MVNNILTMK
jgi:hypothetical protein